MSVIAADGNLYLHFANGTIALAKATPEDYKVISSFKVPHTGIRLGWAHPIIADGKLFVRDENYIWCYDLKAAEAKIGKLLPASPGQGKSPLGR
jgi:outer membrane protein assembly factor BamB